MDADKIIVIDNGHIEEQGNRDELLSLGGIYSRMEAANSVSFSCVSYLFSPFISSMT